MHNSALLGAAACLLLALAVGAYRQWFLRLLKTSGLEMPAKELDANDLPVPGDGRFAGKLWRARSATWFLVTALSVAGAELRVSQLTPPGIRRQWFAFLSILLIRWIFSALIGRSCAQYTLQKTIRS